MIKTESQNFSKANKGITVMEVLLVITIIGILGGGVSPFLSSFVMRNNIKVTTDKVIGIIRKAQNYAMDGKNNYVWGICVNSNRLRLFGGAAGATCTSNSFTEEFQIPESVNIAGFTETTFSRLRGEPSSTMNITITTDLDTTSVSVNEAGGMTIN